METYEVMSCDDAIKLLEKMKKKNKDCKVVVTAFDFRNGTSNYGTASPDGVCVMVKKSNTVILNRDDFIPHMQLFSIKQIPENIVREGIMHDVLLRI